MANLRFIVILIIVLFSLNSMGQNIKNVRIAQEGKTVIVIYDLVGKPGNYYVNLFYTLDDGKTWQGPLEKVTGDIGGQLLGLNKKAIWNVASEKGQLEGTIQFKLNAVPVNLSDHNFKAQIAKLTYSPEYYKYKKNKNLWLVSALTSSAVGAFSYIQSEKYYKQYQDASADASNLHQKVKLYDKITPIAFGVTGFCALEFIIKAGKQSKGKKQSLSLYSQPLKNGGGIGLAYTF